MAKPSSRRNTIQLVYFCDDTCACTSCGGTIHRFTGIVQDLHLLPDSGAILDFTSWCASCRHETAFEMRVFPATRASDVRLHFDHLSR